MPTNKSNTKKPSRTQTAPSVIDGPRLRKSLIASGRIRENVLSPADEAVSTFYRGTLTEPVLRTGELTPSQIHAPHPKGWSNL